MTCVSVHAVYVSEFGQSSRIPRPILRIGHFLAMGCSAISRGNCCRTLPEARASVADLDPAEHNLITCLVEHKTMAEAFRAAGVSDRHGRRLLKRLRERYGVLNTYALIAEVVKRRCTSDCAHPPIANARDKIADSDIQVSNDIRSNVGGGEKAARLDPQQNGV